MAFTVKQVAAMSGISVRTLHFYDETGLLKPAYCAPNGYRFYEEPQLLMLQQILFYRELGFDLKRVAEIIGRRDFEKVAALESHLEGLQQELLRVSALLGTIEAGHRGARPLVSCPWNGARRTPSRRRVAGRRRRPHHANGLRSECDL